MVLHMLTTHWIPLGDVPREASIPGRRQSLRITKGSVYRWAMRGLRGGTVRLRTEMVGGTRCTTRAWLDEFLAALNAGERAAASATPRSPARRARESAEADRLLKERLG
jgi:hypothetical protein